MRTLSILLILSALCITTSVFAQRRGLRSAPEKTPKTVIGLEAGFNLYGLVSENEDYDYNFSFSPAILVKTKLSQKASLTTGLRFIRKGAETNYNINNFYFGELDYNLDYVEVPLQLYVNLNRRFYLKGGVYYAYLLDASFDFLGRFAAGFGELVTSDFERNDFGASIGLGVQLRRGIHLGLQYQRSFIDIAADPALQAAIGATYHQGFSLTMTRFFGERTRRNRTRSRRRF